jgi:hypothetical protein
MAGSRGSNGDESSAHHESACTRRLYDLPAASTWLVSQPVFLNPAAIPLIVAASA